MNDKPTLGRPSDDCTIRMTLLVTPDEAKTIHDLRGDVPLSGWLRAVIRRELGRAGTVILRAADEKLTTICNEIKTPDVPPASPPQDSDDLRLEGQRS